MNEIEDFEPEDEDNCEEGEEAEEPRGLRAPLKVSKEQQDAHEMTHSPYHAWCRHCDRDRGRNALRSSEEGRQEPIDRCGGRQHCQGRGEEGDWRGDQNGEAGEGCPRR